MKIHFYDDPMQSPKSRDEVRINQIGVYIYPDRRRVAIGVDMTPFLERPSVEVTVTNARGERAGSMTVIEALEPNFTLTVHMRDQKPTDTYKVQADVYYRSLEKGRELVHSQTTTFDLSRVGEQ